MQSIGTILPNNKSIQVSDKLYQQKQDRINKKIERLKLDRFYCTVSNGEKQFFINDNTYFIVSSRNLQLLFFQKKDNYFYAVKDIEANNLKKLHNIQEN